MPRTFDLTSLDGFAAVPFPEDYPADRRTFFSPVDDVHGVLKTVLASARFSVVLAMYGFDDEELADIIKEKLEHPHIVVHLTLDSSQAGGVHERTILAREDYPNSVVVTGRSERGAIMHEKILVVDGILTVTGSTNWSDGGETKQDNECSVHLSRAFAARARDRADGIHASMVAKAKKAA